MTNFRNICLPSLCVSFCKYISSNDINQLSVSFVVFFAPLSVLTFILKKTIIVGHDSVVFQAPCTSLAVNHRLETIAVGTAEGTLVILNSYNGMHIATVQVVDDPIGCLTFSRGVYFLFQMSLTSLHILKGVVLIKTILQIELMS